MPWLVDTNVLSELVRPKPNPGVIEWATDVERVTISVVTLEEIVFGLSWKPNARVRRWFATFFDESCEILPITRLIAERAGALRGELQSAGKTRTQADALIAATAQVNALTLVTPKTRDFDGTGVPLLNPFR